MALDKLICNEKSYYLVKMHSLILYLKYSV